MTLDPQTERIQEQLRAGAALRVGLGVATVVVAVLAVYWML
jgi:hypothetical protein